MVVHEGHVILIMAEYGALYSLSVWQIILSKLGSIPGLSMNTKINHTLRNLFPI